MSDPAKDTHSPADLPILVVDDERSMREFLTVMLKKDGHAVEVAANGEDAAARIEAGERFKLLMTDLKMPGIGGLDVLRAIKDAQPSCQVIVMTAYATAETALSAIKLGAYDYITKPFKIDEARVAVNRALEKFALVSENLYLRDVLDHRQGMGELIGNSPAMQRVFQMISRVAPTRTTILIHGESGTGKELVAKAIHQQSPNSEGPFLPINCGAIPENLIESELFGHKKGAFTGAHTDKEGLFCAAGQGTVFLDEVGELPQSVQVKLLRVLQERKVRPVGESSEKDVRCRIVAATNRDLREEVSQGRFREDLYYRLSVIPVEMPPLRERGSDVQLLLEHFLQRYAEEIGNPIEGIDARALAILTGYTYPGNVRELQNIVERAVTLETGSMISTESLPYHLQEENFTRVAREIDVPEDGVDMEKLVEELERNLIARALERADGVKTEAARLLNISFRSLRYRLDKYGLNDD